jgi:eukaryotic-like serine/threonine-protein kinase
VTTILVVDDNADNRELLARRLEREGLQTRTAEDGRAALTAVAQGDVSLVLLDIMMPGMSGLDVLRAIREVHTAAQLPVVMVTARSDSDDVVEALGLGANDYVTKPVDFAVALARIQAQLRIRQPARPEGDDLIASASDVTTGMVLGGRYRLEARIGTGSFGSVYRARHLELDHPVAVKVLKASAATTSGAADALARFRREGATACRVKHPHAVSVLDFAVTSHGVAYLVMELLAGYPLEEEMKGGRLLPVERCLSVMVPVLEALAEAHRSGIVHRDIKPANIFLHQAGGREVPKVVDFGIATLMGGAALKQRVTVEGWIVGTPAYMAPERFRNQPVEGRADVYSAGVMLFQMLAGRVPFESDQSDPMAVAMQHVQTPPPALSVLRPEVPPAVEAAVGHALRKRPAERPTALELAAALRRAI